MLLKTILNRVEPFVNLPAFRKTPENEPRGSFGLAPVAAGAGLFL
jgi:hypothetical protein